MNDEFKNDNLENDQLEQEALTKVFAEIADSDDDGKYEVEGGSNIFAELIDPDGMTELADFAMENDDEEIPGFDVNPFGDLFDHGNEEEIPEVGFGWLPVFWVVILLGSMVAVLLNVNRTASEQQKLATIRNTALQIGSDVQDITYQALLASNGSDEAFDRLQSLRTRVDENINKLDIAEAVRAGFVLSAEGSANLSQMNADWEQLGHQVDLLAKNRGVISSTLDQVTAVNELTPVLSSQTDVLVNRLIENEASLKLINVGSRQRFLSQRIKASANEFAMGAPGWQGAVSQFEQDVKLFGDVNDDIRTMGGVSIVPDLVAIDGSYKNLVSSAESIIGNVTDYATIRDAAIQIDSFAGRLQADATGLIESLNQDFGKPDWYRNLSWILGGIGALGLVGLIWSLLSHNRKRERANVLRTKRSEDAVIKLLDEMGDLAQGDLRVEAAVTNEITGAIADSVNFAIGEMRILVNGIKSASNEVSSTTEDTEQLIAQLLTSSDAQSEEILNSAQEIEKMSGTMNRMSESALQSSDRARVATEAAKKGATAVQNTILGMNTTRNQIQDTAKRLKRLGESSQQINEIVNLIQDVTEQTNVLSLNASIQAAMAGEAGRGFAVVAEEVQRLADRSARASGEITDLVKNIQQDANNAISSMETTTEEVVTGATMADEAGQALDEIEKISKELYDVIETMASGATEESRAATTVSERMNTLKEATEQSDLSVSQVASALGNIRGVVGKLDKSVAGFQLP